MKRLYTSIILLLLYFPVLGQLVFEQLPRDLQLYPRDATNQARVLISGRTSAAGYTKVSTQVLRAGKLTSVVSQSVNPAINTAPFSLSASIRAELAEYSFRVFAYRGADSTLIVERKRVVCGDVYILYGQSNALALVGLDTYYSVNFDDTYLRTADYPVTAKPAEISWYPAKQPFGSVGGVGLTIQRLILQNYGIPTCVLNGAQGGLSLAPLLARDQANHANTGTFYGNLLYRAQWAGVASQVKGIIWRQGEEDVGSGIPGYADKFKTLYNQLREDYGNTRIYVGQINILADKKDGAAEVRDFQRRTKSLFSNVETIATVGTPGYQGVHYDPLGYQRLAFEQYRQIARDVYGAKDTLQINSPNIKKVVANARRDSITLVFDDQMQMIWTTDTTFFDFSPGGKNTVRQLKDYFYFDGQAGVVAAGSADGSRITLALKQPSQAKTLRYLPAYFSDGFSTFYDGPTLKNKRGMRAFSFDKVSIVDAILPVTTLAAKPFQEGNVQLSWITRGNAQAQTLERSVGSTTNFKQIALLNGTVATYLDSDPLAAETYYYRLKNHTSTSESAYSNVVSVRPLVLGLEPAEPVVHLFPNPLAGNEPLRVTANQVTFTEYKVLDMLGRIVKSGHGTARNAITMEMSGLESGLYSIRLQTAEGQTIDRKVIIR
ncbi:sialate O-acetylesterase [Spirosoma luteum]|uniref:sialate O-acetylesterase n=1 Tax=Spirosoma luteum TaxID=431553 RepID=UPI000475856C|nr:sialate O-acetylesterase [Spirosoma luteum]